jgi:hypothetical protein
MLHALLIQHHCFNIYFLGAHSEYHSMVTGGSFPGRKAARALSWLNLQPVLRSRICWSIHLCGIIASLVKHMGNFIFIFTLHTWWNHLKDDISTAKAAYFKLIMYTIMCEEWKTENTAGGNPLRWPHNILYPQKLELTSPTSGDRLVSIVHSQTKATEFSLEWNNEVILTELWESLTQWHSACQPQISH